MRGRVRRWKRVNKCHLAIPSFQHHSDPTGWNLGGWKELTKVISLEGSKCPGRAMLLDMPFIHLLKLTRVRGPASLLGLGDIMSAWSPDPLPVCLNAGFLSSHSWWLSTSGVWPFSWTDQLQSLALCLLPPTHFSLGGMSHPSLFNIHKAPYTLRSITETLSAWNCYSLYFEHLLLFRRLPIVFNFHFKLNKFPF